MIKVNVYSKFCMGCVLGESWGKLLVKAVKKGYDVKVHRTTYRPLLHKKASKLYGSQNYAFFFEIEGEIKSLEEFKEMIDDIKDKRVKSGKKKPVRRKNGMSTRKPKRIRVDSVESEVVEIKVENKA